MLDNEYLRLPPHDLEAERCLVGSLMLNHGSVSEIKSVIRESDFFQQDNAIVFKVLCDLSDAGKPFDAVIFKNELARRDLLEEIGGVPYLAQILSSVPSAAHLNHYANIVLEKSKLRRVITFCNDGIRRCYAPTELDAADKVAMDLAASASLLATQGRTDDIQSLWDIVTGLIDDRAHGKVTRSSSGLLSLDNIIGGLAPGKFTLVASRPGMGKSQLCKQFAYNFAEEGHTVGIVAVEEDDEKIAENTLANFTGYSNNKIAYNQLQTPDWHEMARRFQDRAETAGRILVKDTAFSISDILATIHRMVCKLGCRFIIVDHIHLIDAESNGNRNEQVSKISRELKTTFRKLNVFNAVAAQLNRGSGIERPELSHLRDSGSLEQDADVVLMLHREDYFRYSEPNFQPDYKLEIHVKKNKSGRLGVAVEKFDGEHQRIEDFPPEDIDPF